MKVSKEDVLFDSVIKHIKKVREQGETPRSDVLAMDSFICDLCRATVHKKNLTQCGFCGRWVCKSNCWDNDQKACDSCVGVIKLSRESFNLRNKKEEVKSESSSKPRKIKKDRKKNPIQLIKKKSD